MNKKTAIVSVQMNMMGLMRHGHVRHDFLRGKKLQTRIIPVWIVSRQISCDQQKRVNRSSRGAAVFFVCAGGEKSSRSAGEKGEKHGK